MIRFDRIIIIENFNGIFLTFVIIWNPLVIVRLIITEVIERAAGNKKNAR